MRGKSTSSWIVVALVCAVACMTAAPALAQSGKAPILWPAGDIKWVDSPGVAGAKIAVLWGDPKTGAYGALKKITGGTVLANHTHTSEQRIVLVAGTISVSTEGGAAKDLPPGSYVFMPGGVKHVATCKAGADCIYFEEQPGASDIKFVDGAAPKK